VPRYLVETAAPDRLSAAAAADLAARKFPEVVLEQGSDGPVGVPAVWVVRAPSRTHVGRWAAAAGLRPTVLRRLDRPVPAAGTRLTPR
jgi:hypothetical protein